MEGVNTNCFASNSVRKMAFVFHKWITMCTYASCLLDYYWHLQHFQEGVKPLLLMFSVLRYVYVLSSCCLALC